MDEKSVVLVALTAVIVVGLVGVIGVMNGMTGAAELSNRYCQCVIRHLDYEGNPLGPDDVQHIRVRSTEQFTDAYCNNACEQHFGRLSNYPNMDVVGIAAPFGTAVTLPGGPYAST